MRFIMIYFTKHTEAAPQAKVKKRKTFKQVIQEKEEKAKEQALKRVEEAKSMKEVRNWYIVATVYLSIFSQSQVSDIYCGSARIFEDLIISEIIWRFLRTFHRFPKMFQIFLSPSPRMCLVNITLLPVLNCGKFLIQIVVSYSLYNYYRLFFKDFGNIYKYMYYVLWQVVLVTYWSIK